MRIDEFHIDGFGRFHQLSVKALHPHLSIVLGGNEAGKSTLLAFLRSVLFGLPTRKQADFYAPFNGGRHGGRLVLTDSDATRVVVERFGGKGTGTFTATFADGSQLGEEQFRQRIGGVTGDVYQNVFAFGLGELQSFDCLKDDRVRDAIYGAGIGSGRQSPKEVVDRLERQHKSLFISGGTNPVINKLLKQLEQRRQLINHHSTDQQEYQRLQHTFREVDVKIGQLEEGLYGSRKRSDRLRTLQQAWEDWITLETSRCQLQTIPKIDSFPHQGVERMDTIRNDQRTLRSELREATDDLREATQQLSAIRFDETVLAIANDIRSLERRVNAFEQNDCQLTQLRREIDLADQQCALNLRNLGDEWTADKLRRFDLSIPAKEEIGAIKQKWDQALQRVENAMTTVDHLQRQFHETQQNERAAQDKLKGLGALKAQLDLEPIRQLQLRQGAYESACRDLPLVQKAYEGNHSRLNEILRSIGPAWNEEQLQRFDNSLATREKIAAHRDKVSQLRSALNQSQTQIDAIQQAVHEHRDALQGDKALLSAIPEVGGTDERSLVKQKSKLRALRALLTSNSPVLADIAHQEERLQDLKEQLSRVQQPFSGHEDVNPRRIAVAIAIIGTLAMLAVGTLGGNWWIGIAVLVIFLAFAMLILFMQRNALTRLRVDHNQQPNEQHIIGRRIFEAEQRIQELRDRGRIFETDILRETQLAGFTKPPEIPQVDQQEELVDQQLNVLQQRRPIERHYEESRVKVERAQSALQTSTRIRTELAEDLQRAQTEWRNWLSELGLPESLTPEVAIDVLSRLDSARELQKANNIQRTRVQEMENAVDSFENLVRLAGANCRSGNLPQEPLAAVQFMVRLLDEHEDYLRSMDEAQRHVDEAAVHRIRAQEGLDDAQRSHGSEVARQDAVNKEWTDLLVRRGLRETLRVRHVEQMLHGIEQARAQLSQLDGLKAKGESISEQVAAFVNDVDSVAQRINRATRPGSISAYVDSLAAMLKEAEDFKCRAEVLRESVQKSTDRVKRLDSQIEERQKEADHLLECAGTGDEESFRGQAVNHEQFKTISNEVASLERRLRQLAGSDDVALLALETELKQSTPEQLQSERQDLDKQIARLEEEIGGANELRGELNVQLQQLESSDEISSLRMHEQSDLAEFRQHAREWAVLKISAYLIDSAREKYERERRPAVLRQAERYFERLTRGEYREIVAPVGGDPVVIGANGSRKELHQLSRGTAEQLYLSLRFGFVEEFVERSGSLPLIFDDILVNFDPARAAAAAEAIVELSRTQQILFFTCHPSTVQLLKECDSDSSVYELENGLLTNGSFI